MSNNPSIRALEDHRAAIKQEMAKHQAELDRLAAELAEADTAERVLKRIGAAPASKGGAASHSRGNGSVPAAMTEKIIAVVAEGNVKQPADVLQTIRERWLPDVEGNDVRPTLWRLVKDGRITKDSTGYHIPK
jgi:hypothetical protein